MAPEEELPREVILRVIKGRADFGVEASIDMLEKLAASLIRIIGENGFESLYFRAFNRATEQFSWLGFDAKQRASAPAFPVLRQSFLEQRPELIAPASACLFGALVDILAPLIGSHLTNTILQSALAPARADK